MDKEPLNTDEYVKFLEYLDASNAKMDDMEAILDYCKELYDIMEEFKIAVPFDDMTNYLGLSVTMASLRNVVDKKLEEYGKYVKRLTEQMNRDISELIGEVGNIKDECLVRIFCVWCFCLVDSNVVVGALVVRHRI